MREPTYYSYTAPEPSELREQPLRPEQARWVSQGATSMAQLPHDAVRLAADPRAALLEFLESAYQAGAGTAGWPRAELQSPWHPAGGGERAQR